MNLTISVRYSCRACDLEDIEVAVPARGTEDVIVWIKATTVLLCEDHRRRSPRCWPESLSDVKIPLTAADRIGGAPLQ